MTIMTPCGKSLWRPATVTGRKGASIKPLSRSTSKKPGRPRQKLQPLPAIRAHRLPPRLLIFGSFVIVFALFFARMAKGTGQYWDWSFPYFGQHMGNFFANQASAWTPVAGGSPLGYASDYAVRAVLSVCGFIPPELCLYSLLVLLCSAGAFGVYSIARLYTRPGLAYVLALAAFINPAIFYKFTAGHLNYFISYAVFIYFVRFLLQRFDSSLKSAVIVGLFLGMIGAQIQFFVIAGFLLVIYVAYHRQRIAWKYLPIIVGLPVLLNMVWLSNFLVGGANVADLSANAAKVTFKSLSATDYLSIFSFSFSKATLIGRFYSFIELLAYVSLFVLLAIMLVRRPIKQRADLVLLVFLLLMIFMATGLFQLLPLGPLTLFYPMLREVGHFAGPIVLMVMLLLARLIRYDRLGWAATGLVIVAIAVSLGKFQNFHQPVDFATMRQAFAEFAAHDSDKGKDDHRVLAYPFFDQYAIAQASMAFQDGLPLKNSGHDSFGTYANQAFIKSAVKPQDFATSPQNRLLQTYDIEVLRPYNVRYIYDFSAIYESYYERYVPKATFNNDLSLIKSDPEFLDKLLQKNPGKLRRVSKHIVEITDFTPRVAATDTLFHVENTQQIDATMQFANKALRQPFFYTDDNRPLPGTTALKRLFDTGSNQNFLNTHTKTFTQKLSLNEQQYTLYANQQKLAAWYRVAGDHVQIVARPTGNLRINDQLLDEQNSGESIVIHEFTAKKGQHYYAGVGDQVREITPGDQLSKIANLDPGETVQIYTAGSDNLVVNPSFEQGLWQEKVTDCNNYDGAAKIGMQLDNQKSDGQRALQLSALRHDACTSTEVKLASNSHYLLRYDYQSDNAAVANFYLAFNNSDEAPVKGFQAITNNRWNQAQQFFTAPEQATTGRLFVYALQSNQAGESTINRYDNFRLIQLNQVQELTVPDSKQDYLKTDLAKSSEPTFTFTDSTYDYANGIHDGSFEAGPWRSKVGDCNKYDNDGAIDMRLNTDYKKDGKQSLELSAIRHAACTYTSANVQAGADYQLSFAYQGDGATQYGYHIGFDDPKNSEATEKLPITDKNWHTFTKTIHVPARAGTLTLHLYAFESNGAVNNIVRYDDVRLVQLPPLTDRYYVVGKSAQPLARPRELQSQGGGAERAITIHGARAPFYLLLSENYHPRWQLSVQGGRTVPNQQHLKFNSYGNAWYIDPVELCKGGGCQHQHDDSYDLKLRAEFTPQRWFEWSRAISAVTFVGALGYLGYAWRRDRPRSWRAR